MRHTNLPVETINRYKDRLSDEQRAVIEKQGETYEKIAADLGINLGTVKSRMSRARTAILKMVVSDTTGAPMSQIEIVAD